MPEDDEIIKLEFSRPYPLIKKLEMEIKQLKERVDKLERGKIKNEKGIDPLGLMNEELRRRL